MLSEGFWWRNFFSLLCKPPGEIPSSRGYYIGQIQRTLLALCLISFHECCTLELCNMAGLPMDIWGSIYSLETAGHHLVGAVSLRVQHHLQKTDWRDRLNLAFGYTVEPESSLHEPFCFTRRWCQISSLFKSVWIKFQHDLQPKRSKQTHTEQWID